MILVLNTEENKEIVARALHRYHCLYGETFHYQEEILHRGPLVGGNCKDLIRKAIDTLWAADAVGRNAWRNKAHAVLYALDHHADENN